MHDLKILSDWSDKWLLKFHPSKTKAGFFFFKKKQLEKFPKLSYINNIVHSAYKKIRTFEKN